MARVLVANEEAIQEAARLLREGKLVAFPTETVYGLGACALNPKAVARVFEVKERPFFDPLIVHVATLTMVQDICEFSDPRALCLAERFWPGPLTIVLPKKPVVPDIVTAGLPTVAVRMPAHPVALRLIQTAGVPIAAPSANRFGRLSPTLATHVVRQLGDRIELILDGGKCPVGVESTVIELVDGPLLLRPGGVPLEEIEKVVGKVKEASVLDVPRSPGQLPFHYAPSVPLRIVSQETLPPPGFRVGLLAFASVKYPERFVHVEILSPSGDLQEAAANLFACLHRLEEQEIDLIFAEPVPEVGLGRAIMDRLRKAEAKTKT
ncbi:MAG: L-threonylcarbamoyladenylate synthase [Candidatus Caldatribacterium sp.]|uniref:L-threonylcarbamoyladenylate synthase n=1 Tax=Candidatus Caldatribacterium sp. TaxID=2282143 RepID=UPI0029975919|nr:L-threonylcarbamoyladenylate synthase [Candidatus Caldatribacterium sp.]MCX7729711.1 L-threonylcarbamoyladenylate synthase [Candidatus Caldatribacterium sp.]MDW8080429.1 L-threonylcarbamoyladenylate synthase [Candidatus Calescibacterium sp.]